MAATPSAPRSCAADASWPIGHWVRESDLPGGAGSDDLEQVEWDVWFEKFDSEGLAFLYQDEKASGEGSTFFKLVNR